MPDQTNTNKLSAAAVAKQVVAGLGEIVRSELELARTEIRQTAPRLWKPLAIIAAGIAIALYGFGFLLAAMSHGIAYVLWPWLAVLIVGELLVAGGVAAVSLSFFLLRKVQPPKALANLKQDFASLRRPGK